MQNHRKYLALAIAQITALGIVTPVFAQTEPHRASIEEVIVTSRRVEESQQDVPLALTALSEEALKDAGVTSLNDLKAIPSFTMSPLTGRRTTLAVQLRGQRSSDATTTVDPAVGIYVAEVPIMRAYGIGALSALDVQSMEIVKGPQGTLFGRNTTGGALLITPNAPTQDVSGSVAIGAGNYNQRNAELVFNAPITDTVAARIAVRTSEHDGYIDNRGPFHDLNDEDSFVTRGSLLWEPSDVLTNTTFVDYFNTSSHSGAKVTAVAPAPSTIRTTFGTAQVDAVAAEQANSKFWSTRNLADSLTEARGQGVSNITSWDLTDDLTIKNILGYRNIDTFDHNLDPFGVILPINIAQVQNNTTQYSEELQLQGTLDRLNWIAGLFWFQEKGNERNDLWTNRVPTPGVFDPNNSADYDVTNTSYSAFSQGTYALTDALNLTLGARWTVDKRELDSVQKNLSNPAIPVCSFRVSDVSTTAVPLSDCERNPSETFEAPTYNISLDYKIDADQLVYVAHRRGYRSGGFSISGTSPGQLKPFSEEIVLDFEVGYKADLDIFNTPLRLNAAYYYSDYQDIQRNISEIVPGSTRSINAIRNAGSAVIQGLELETTWLPVDAIEVGLFYAYTDAYYKEFESSEVVGTTVRAVDLSDNEFAPVPEHQGGLNVTWKQSLGEAGELRVMVGGYWQSRIAGNTTNKLKNTNTDMPGVFQAGYGLYNARITWDQVFGKPLTLAVWGKNLTDTEYFGGTSAQYETSGYSAGYFGDPRTFGVEARYAF